MQRQVDEVWAEIEPEAGAGARFFSPALADKRAEAVHVGLEVHDLAENSGGEDGLRGENIALPAAVLKDGEEALVFAGDADKLTSLGEIEGEGFVDDDVLSCAERSGGEREVAVVGSSNDDEVS